eukprot:gb/GEZN01000345.1/.p2 GENE.gb/GEZN01000345.1/~~gb/GEZN01000345.1/.p2  ORF type:complete len:205 (-),score=39.75 gb/GEZN01000345.1/:3434-4048(-)
MKDEQLSVMSQQEEDAGMRSGYGSDFEGVGMLTNADEPVEEENQDRKEVIIPPEDPNKISIRIKLWWQPSFTLNVEPAISVKSFCEGICQASVAFPSPLLPAELRLMFEDKAISSTSEVTLSLLGIVQGSLLSEKTAQDYQTQILAEYNPDYKQQLMKALKSVGDCPAGFVWNKVQGGYLYGGGGHFVTDAKLEAYATTTWTEV